MPGATFCELTQTGLVSFAGPDAAAFLQAQLTSDVAALIPPRTQYSGYCTPKGRLLATFLLWRLPDETLIQLPRTLSDAIRSRLLKYVLRSKVSVTDGASRYVLFGIAGPEAERVVTALGTHVPGQHHDVTLGPDFAVSCLPGERYIVLSAAACAANVRSTLSGHAAAAAENTWAELDVQTGIPVVTEASQEQYVPQMVNLDLIGAVSYSKGCYPGQEIVARTHYLGRIKQRTYRVRLPDGVSAKVGDRLFSNQYGADQASGTILNVAPTTKADDALAVIYTNAIEHGIHYGAIDGPAVQILPLPYSVEP